jgi:hypothetical protein
MPEPIPNGFFCRDLIVFNHLRCGGYNHDIFEHVCTGSGFASNGKRLTHPFAKEQP